MDKGGSTGDSRMRGTGGKSHEGVVSAALEDNVIKLCCKGLCGSIKYKSEHNRHTGPREGTEQKDTGKRQQERQRNEGHEQLNTSLKAVTGTSVEEDSKNYHACESGVPVPHRNLYKSPALAPTHCSSRAGLKRKAEVCPLQCHR